MFSVFATIVLYQLTHTCDNYSYKKEGDGGQCPVRLVSVSSHVYDRGRGRMEEGGGRCMVRRIPHSVAHVVQLVSTSSVILLVV